MDASFIPIEAVPSQTPFALDQLRRSYKTSLSAEDALAVCPEIGASDETFPYMFLMPISTPESAESATRVDLIYMGAMRSLGDIVLLPAHKHDTGTDVQSATSNYGSSGNAAQSITIQYYAPTNTLSYFSEGAAGVLEADDPSADPVVIAIVIGGINFAPGDLATLVSTFFTPNIVSTIATAEVVPTKYWQNVAKKTKGYLPYVVTAPPPGTAIVALAAPGQNYTVGDVLTITAGGETATLTVTALGIGQSVLTFTVLTNTFTVQQLFISATGGTGAGAVFNVVIV